MRGLESVDFKSVLSNVLNKKIMVFEGGYVIIKRWTYLKDKKVMEVKKKIKPTVKKCRN